MDKRHLKRIKRRDRIARWIISAGGMGVIVCVLTMLLLILSVALPLFRPAAATLKTRLSPPAASGQRLLTAGMDDFFESAFVLDDAGVCHFADLLTRQWTDTIALAHTGAATARHLLSVTPQPGHKISLLWDDGVAQLVRIIFRPEFKEGKRHITHAAETLALLPAPPEIPAASTLTVSDEGAVTQVALFAPNRFVVRRQAAAVGDGGGVAAPLRSFDIALDNAEAITAFTTDKSGANLYAGTRDGLLLHWDIAADSGATLKDRILAFADRRAVTALAMVFGDISLAVGDANGGVTTWSPVSLYGPETGKRLELIHRLPSHRGPVVALVPTEYDKGVISLGADGTLQVSHMTSERLLLTLRPDSPLRQVQLSLQGNGLAALNTQGELRVWQLRNPHPEFSWRVLFGKAWYENYDEPKFVWQSSSANDEFEAKYSFVPLVFGSLKATFYAMLFAVPLALFGAIYTSQFTSYEVRAFVKPTVEIMAAVPSVVIGFLAALWLAPRVERAVVGVFVFAILLPFVTVLFLAVWQRCRRFDLAKRIERGYEFLAVVPTIALAAALAGLLAPGIESLFFHGDFKLWLFQHAGMRYDQRNSLIIAFALGFAVIPIIFTITEDALSNVPKSLKAASLALGASRWQTVWRVVLPSASPGVFAAMIIGFGRAVGETMIVLMATGNTPILDLSPFSGMRTLAANIAVEIPEAPEGGTLFRILFLSAVLLFLLTSVLNTAAELIRQRLRKRFGY